VSWRFPLIFLFAVVLLGCGKGSTATPSVPAPGDAIISATGVTIDGKHIPIPFTTDQIVAVLGLPSRSLQGEDAILTWDDQGIRATIKKATDRGTVIHLVLDYGNGEDNWPKKSFAHSIWINGVQLSISSKAAELQAAGLRPHTSATFLWMCDMGGCSVLSHTDLQTQNLILVSLSEKTK
jgi:hypothetical protein